MIKQFLLVVSILFVCSTCKAQTIYISTKGNDNNAGSIYHPVKTFAAGVAKAMIHKNKKVIIEIDGGTYPVDKTVEITSEKFPLRELTIKAKANEKVIISGARQFKLSWKPYKNNMVSAKIKLNKAPDQLFMNGKKLPMARYPDFDSTARVFNGTAANAISIERSRKWLNPTGGYIHALHQGEWGDFHYRITGKDATDKLLYEGGWQNNRPAKMHTQYRYVENIFEELDHPGEWFYNQKEETLYLIPPVGSNLQTADFAFTMISDILHIKGTLANPVKNITITGVDFVQTARSFMEVKEPLLRSDWAIYRGAAILLEGTESCIINNCNFYDLGGSAVFLSNYNKEDRISNNHIYNIGANGIAFVGNPNAVRSPAFRYENFVPYAQMDMERGPKNADYPQHCQAINNLIHHTGSIEKQSAGVQISMSASILVSHNTIYHVPRAGINISEGTWGGHIIEFNDVFDTVLETGDHGAFNSWGRDRYWRPERSIIDSIVAAKPGIELLDVIAPIVLRNNRFQCDHGWDIDLDDGSTNYQIYNNVCLSGGLKLREGYHRTVFNNIIINNTFHPHVWLKNSDDVFKNNILTAAYAPILMESWGKEIDHNFFLSKEALIKTQKLNVDANSLSGEAGFVEANTGNYHLKKTSAVFKTGFKDFDMNFGVTNPRLKKLTASPAIKPLNDNSDNIKTTIVDWLGARFKNIETLGERSAAGLPDNNGALLTQLTKGSVAEKNNLKKGDVVVQLDNNEVKSVNELIKIYNEIRWKGHSQIIIIRNQKEQRMEVSLKD
ncbi:peptide-binding protein [Pedobacter kyungheensis]|uniref:Peptide-binding protein n=1 Tax=Pedobacter kyungheensis TaxID=1069985 RepID=A0A0C1DEH3_9SPHI|nr:PDZ domain-containing protein [Pedobacter kyungheensis]KIA92365.1 peptide-binding protein [Pedobacter kyungheensis]